jgi:hypothetical protein
METITNLANTAVGTASKLIYGDQTQNKTEEAVDTTKNNETAGKEPVSGVEGKGTATQPFDQGNARKFQVPYPCCRRVGPQPSSATVAGNGNLGILTTQQPHPPAKTSAVSYPASFVAQQHATC